MKRINYGGPCSGSWGQGVIKSTKRYVYIMINHNNGLYKIGHSYHPWKRRQSLKWGIDGDREKLELLGHFCICKNWDESVEAEYKYLEALDDYHVGNEWFSIPDEIINALEIHPSLGYMYGI